MKKTSKLSSLLLALASLVSGFAFAEPALAAVPLCTQEKLTVTFVGVDDEDGTVYVSVSGAAAAAGTCTGSNIHTHFRFKPDTSNVQAALSILLAAKLSGNMVRIDKKFGDDLNSASHVYLQ